MHGPITDREIKGTHQHIHSPLYVDVPDWHNNDNYENSEVIYGTMNVGGSLIDRVVSPAPSD